MRRSSASIISSASSSSSGSNATGHANSPSAQSITSFPGINNNLVLPPPEIMEIAVQTYFAYSECCFPMLHKTRFAERRPIPALLLTSMLLAAPYLAPAGTIPGTATRRELEIWEQPLFAAAAAELEPALAWGTPSIELVVSVANMAIWALFKGLGTLGRRLSAFAQVLAYKAKILSDPCSFGSKTNVSWEQLAQVSLGGPDWLTLALDSKGVHQIRALWIDYWTRERIAWSLLRLSCSLTNYDVEEAEADSMQALFSADAMHGRRSHPMPAVWEASFSADFDPRMFVEPDGKIADAVSWQLLDRTDPMRIEALERMKLEVLTQRCFFETNHAVLRHRVDAFLGACKAGGFPSPADLPSELPVAEGPVPAALASLILQRDALDADLADFVSAMPPDMIDSLTTMSATNLAASFYATSGSLSFAYVGFFKFIALQLMRIELWSSFGCYLGSCGAKDCELDILEAEFAKPDSRACEFLPVIFQCTRILESWLQHNSSMPFHAGRGRPIFNLMCFHLALLGENKKPGGMKSVNPEIIARHHDVAVCMRVLEQLAERGPWLAHLYKLATRLTHGIRVCELLVEQGIRRVDLIDELGPEMEEGHAELNTVLAVFRHRLASCR